MKIPSYHPSLARYQTKVERERVHGWWWRPLVKLCHFNDHHSFHISFIFHYFFFQMTVFISILLSHFVCCCTLFYSSVVDYFSFVTFAPAHELSTTACNRLIAASFCAEVFLIYETFEIHLTHSFFSLLLYPSLSLFHPSRQPVKVYLELWRG
jgi:hypothetical protein